MTAQHYIACDLGAESGRVILGTLTGGALQLEEIHRFATGPIRVASSLRWNILGIFEELKRGLRKVAERGVPVAGVSVDSWGVDYVLMGDGQPLIALPHHYRDPRTEGTYTSTMERVGCEKIFVETGIQFMPINTLYQLIADAEQSPALMGITEQFLNIADYLNYLFSGVARAEVSLASTTQIYNPSTGAWSDDLIDACKLRPEIFPEIVQSGTRLGPLAFELEEETGLTGVEVTASCSHDTAAAVAAVPSISDDWAYLSSGTWSLIGVELRQPLITDAAREHNFTNEAGYGNTTRFLKNIVGLWLLQESRRAWERQGLQLDYSELHHLAEEAEPLRSLIHPNDSRFLGPNNMPAEIAGYCLENGQVVPETPGQFARCILESLALLYRQCLDNLEEVTGRTIRTLHVVGGGSQSRLLNQFTANTTARTVLAGPVEATAIGNLLIQAIAMGQLDSLDELRRVVRNSFTIDTYKPQTTAQWQQAAERFANLEPK